MIEVLTNVIVAFHNIYVYQIITLYTLNLQMLYINYFSVELEKYKFKANDYLFILQKTIYLMVPDRSKRTESTTLRTLKRNPTNQ